MFIAREVTIKDLNANPEKFIDRKVIVYGDRISDSWKVDAETLISAFRMDFFELYDGKYSIAVGIRENRRKKFQRTGNGGYIFHGRVELDSLGDHYLCL